MQPTLAEQAAAPRAAVNCPTGSVLVSHLHLLDYASPLLASLAQPRSNPSSALPPNSLILPL